MIKIESAAFGHKSVDITIFDYPKVKVKFLLRGKKESIYKYADNLRKVIHQYIKDNEKEII